MFVQCGEGMATEWEAGRAKAVLQQRRREGGRRQAGTVGGMQVVAVWGMFVKGQNATWNSSNGVCAARWGKSGVGGAGRRCSRNSGN